MTTVSSIFLITGPPGAGKTSIATRLMQRFSLGLHIPVDDIREWVVSGIAHPVPDWTEETGRQFLLARQAAAEVARRYASAGFAVAIDDIIYPAEAQALFIDALPGHQTHKIILLPSVEVAIARNAARTNKDFDTGPLAEPIRDIRRRMDREDYDSAGWITIDNSELGIDETVDRILGSVGMERPPL